MKKNCFLFIFLFAAIVLYGQNITVDFPFHAGKPLHILLKKGAVADTLFTGKFDMSGKIQIPLPGREYVGMASLNLEKGGGVDFIVNGEDFAVTSSEEYPYGGNVTFSNSPENESLQRWFIGQAVRQQKIRLLSEIEMAYSDNDAFKPILKKEKMQLDTQQQAFEDSLRSSKLYAAKFIGYYNLLGKRIAPLGMSTGEQMADMRTFVRDSLDINNLYTSGLWFSVLNGLLALYDNDVPYHKDFTNDMSLLLKKAESSQVYNSLAESLFAICESTGWNDLEEQLAYFLINDGRIENPTGKLKMLMTLFKLGKGSQVPALSQGTLPVGSTLLVFYESGCGPCENEIQQLTGNYSLLKSKGYEVVSVSADKDADIFNNTAGRFPWEGKYCDLKGFNGPDFQNYGVVGTPTFYVIKDGIIQGRYARLVDAGLLDGGE